MKPFKMFFGIAVAAILLFFVARVVFMAFVIAAVMSVLYAVFRRLKDFITYDSYGEPYIPARKQKMQTAAYESPVEPLFNEGFSKEETRVGEKQAEGQKIEVA